MTLDFENARGEKKNIEQYDLASHLMPYNPNVLASDLEWYQSGFYGPRPIFSAYLTLFISVDI